MHQWIQIEYSKIKTSVFRLQAYLEWKESDIQVNALIHKSTNVYAL